MLNLFYAYYRVLIVFFIAYIYIYIYIYIIEYAILCICSFINLTHVILKLLSVQVLNVCVDVAHVSWRVILLLLLLLLFILCYVDVST